MNKVFLNALLIFLLIAGSAVSEVFIESEKTAVQGDISPVYIVSDENMDNVSLFIKRGENTYGKFRGFKYPVQDKDKSCSVILISFASDVYPADYTLDIRWQSEGYAYRRTKNITINKQKFRSEDISLSKGLTTLRKDESERRKRETKAIIHLYRRFNRNSSLIEDGFSYPLEGNPTVTSFFGDRRNFLYTDGGSDKSLHNGIDYAALKGTPVFSAGKGRVVFAGDRLVTGNSVIIEHLPGFYSVYYHMDKISVSVNTEVAGGEKIGEVGSTGMSTGNHLHWEVRNQGIAVDPQQFIASPPIDKSKIISIINSSFSDIDQGG